MRRSKAVASTVQDDGATVHRSRAVDSLSSNPSILRLLQLLLFDPSYSSLLSTALLLLELLLGALIIRFVPYTEIDWVAYMQEVSGFLHGERDYRLLKGDTGPLVYPAGFLYLYSALYYLTDEGRDVRLAQYTFLALYLLTLWLVHRIYMEVGGVPPYVLVLLSLSKRVHSIYVLRLFNDCWAMFGLYAAVLFVVRRRWWLSAAFLSLALSIKMNILLFAPAYLIILLHSAPLPVVAGCVALMAAVQAALGLPFLLTYPLSYLSKAFEFSRVFLYRWTVNLKVLPEPLFLAPQTAVVLLAGHVTGLAAVLQRWSRGGVRGVLERTWTAALALITERGAGGSSGGGDVKASSAVWLLFVTNFIGVAFARSLHYQFYSWYWHTLPFLLHASYTPFPAQLGTGLRDYAVVAAKVVLLMSIELCWNVYPATWWSSALLIACHAVLLAGVLLGNGVDYTSRAKGDDRTTPKVRTR